MALKELILSKDTPRNQIIIFDSGLSECETYDAITSKGNYFISRLNSNYRVKEDKEEGKKKSVEKIEKKEIETLTITKEIKGKLYTSDGNETQTSYRIIHGTQKDKPMG